MSRITKIFAAAAAFTMLGAGSAFAADCGAKPEAPALASADGATIASKDMSALAETFDAYQTKFIDFSDCINKEFNETQTKFKEVVTAYQAKSKKK